MMVEEQHEDPGDQKTVAELGMRPDVLLEPEPQGRHEAAGERSPRSCAAGGGPSFFSSSSKPS